MFPFIRNDKEAAHIMLDLETLGRVPGSAIIQIGACRFNPAKGILDKFERSIDMKSLIDKGFKVDGETLAWWFYQSDDARKSVTTKTVPVTTALAEFTKFVRSSNDVLWSHKDFDASILRGAYDLTGMRFPFNYRNIYDLRTLDMIAKLLRVSSTRTREGTHHTGLDDAIYQAGIASDLIMGIIR